MIQGRVSDAFLQAQQNTDHAVRRIDRFFFKKGMGKKGEMIT